MHTPTLQWERPERQLVPAQFHSSPAGRRLLQPPQPFSLATLPRPTLALPASVVLSPVAPTTTAPSTTTSWSRRQPAMAGRGPSGSTEVAPAGHPDPHCAGMGRRRSAISPPRSHSTRSRPHGPTPISRSAPLAPCAARGRSLSSQVVPASPPRPAWRSRSEEHTPEL